jgi:hypothetical protein
MCFKPSTEPFSLKKTPLIVGIIAIGIFFAFNCSAIIVSEDFEEMAENEWLCSQGYWEYCYASSTISYYATSTGCADGMCGYINSPNYSSPNMYHIAEATSSAGVINIDIVDLSVSPTLAKKNWQWILYNQEHTNFITKIIFSSSGIYGYYRDSPYSIFMTDAYPTEGGFTLSIQWDLGFSTEDYLVRWAVNDEWTDWYPAVVDEPAGAFAVFGTTNDKYGWVLFDNIEQELGCDPDNLGLCETWDECNGAGGFWQYSYYSYEYYCGAYPTGECSYGILDCQYCSSSSTCEAQETCYWSNDFCWYGTGACGEGIELQFCDNQGDCETQGGNWYNDFCWLYPPYSVSSWDDYYSTYGDYATATEWTNNMASSSTAFFETIGGFLNTFNDFFSVETAYQKGSEFGSAIPKARGYLGIFGEFTGGLPIGEIFIFAITFMLAIGVFRIVRNLVQLIKFW